jgi:acyl-CoA reductase-like NAD-dependent aldehyde dehydrogenase
MLVTGSYVSDVEEDLFVTVISHAGAAQPAWDEVACLRHAVDFPQRQMFIAGGWQAAADGACSTVTDPATRTMIATVAHAGPADVARATAAARQASDHGSWPGMRPRERGQVLLRAAALIREQSEELARLESLDVGKPIKFTRGIDVPTVIDTLEYYAGLASGIEGAVRQTVMPSFAYTRREPVGVVGVITPFNFPLIMSMTKIAAALVAGNTVVHKPAEETPLSALRLAEILQEAGVPDGAYNVVTGDGVAGAALVRDPAVDKITFTGSARVGRKVAAAAAETLKHASVDLGGKAANIIFADSDLESAIQTAIAGFVFNTGQFCMAGSRLLVERAVYDDVLAALAGAIPHVPVGDPFDETTVVGPMAGPAHQARVESFLTSAVKDGGQILARGQRPASGGFFVPPTLVAGIGQSAEIVQEEIFGPVLTVQPFDTEDEAIRMANGTSHCLAAGLQTRSLPRAHRVSAALKAGIVWVNGWALLDPSMPFGGTGRSGLGHETGPEAFQEYLRTKSIMVVLG